MMKVGMTMMLTLGTWTTALGETAPLHGLVGLRPLPITAEQASKANHGGSWAGCPTFDEQKGNYPFCAEHVDVIKGWLDGDFKTKRMFFEYYWGLDAARDDLDPEKNLLIKTIQGWEVKGGEIEHILICREYDLAIRRGHNDAQPGPFKEDTRILFEKDVDDIRAMFRHAHKAGLTKHDNYKLIQMVQHPTFFADDKRFLPIMAKVDGIAYECHQFNRHWPLETGWSAPEKVVRGAKWTLAQGKEYIFYYGPIRWKGKFYYEFMERDWLEKYWKAGLPKHHPKMHYYLNTFPNEDGRGRPVGPETDPHSVLGLTKWLIKEIKSGPPGGEREMQKRQSADVSIPFEDMVISSSTARVVAGQLQLRIPKGVVEPCNLPLRQPVDLSAYRYLLTTVKNTGHGTVVLRMAVRDAGAENYWEWGYHSFGIVVVRPGETKPLVACLAGSRPAVAYLKDYLPGMHTLPGLFEFNFWRSLDTGKVAGIQLLPVGADPTRERKLVLSAFRGVLPISAPTEASLKDGSFFPLVDAYGQYRHLDWPDKIRTDRDLVKMRRKEEAWLAARSAMPSGWNEYGGWAAGPQLKATGHFRTEKYQGKWWLVDPTGRLFWSKGATGIGFSIGGRTPLEPASRRKFFPEIPASAIVTNRRGVTELVIGQQMEALKYGDLTGEDWKNDLSIRRAWAFGLNTAGAWSSVRATAQRRLPYALILHPWSPPFRENLMDPFHPGFRAGIEKAVQATAGKEAEDPWCIGYFIHNELNWMGPLALGQAALTHPPDQPAKRELLRQLQAKYATIEKLNAAWHRAYASWEALAGIRAEDKLTPPMEQDLVAFGEEFCETFFRIIGEVMKQHAPHKLYLGDRFNKNVPSAIRACARHADVVSFNKYDPGIENLQLPTGSADKPILIGEFCFVRGGRRHDSAELGAVFDPDYRGRAYAQYILGALANPSVVGCHWFQWGTQPVTGRGDGENYEQGYLDGCDTPDWELAHYSRGLADHMYDIRLRGTIEFDYQPPRR